MSEKEKKLSSEEIIDYFKDEFADKIKDSRIKKVAAGSQKHVSERIWIKIDKNIFKDFIKHLCDLQFPHLAVVSGNDLGEKLELIYHFTLNSGERMQEIVLNVSVELPKSNPEIETICDYIPGALITEREKQEFLGVKIKGIPDERKVFLPDDFPDDVYPWRRDEKGMEKYIRNLHDQKEEEE
ncbi:MAG: NADH-quinone oxidoreductase subunit C [Candidatus Thermoplasmatota archaeon]